MLVGKITTSVGGNSTLSVSWFTNTIPTDPGSVVWDCVYSFNETARMTHFLLWENGTSYNSAIDALRVADTGCGTAVERPDAPASPACTWAATAASSERGCSARGALAAF